MQQPLPVAPGKPARFDHHYVRNGVANLFLLLEPLTGRCEVKVTECRTKRDWTRVMKDLVDLHYPEADRITLVMDNLSTHQKTALYEVFRQRKPNGLRTRSKYTLRRSVAAGSTWPKSV